MRTSATRFMLALVVLAPQGCISRPQWQDISPDLANGTVQASASSAGLTIALAGGASRLYAVSLNAGVWRSDGPDQPWVWLKKSPPHATSIAVDPADGQHVVVGEREDDVADVSARHSGLWESRDGGDTWSYILDPRALGCPSQAVPSVAVGRRGAVFAATSCGIARPKGTVVLRGSTAFELAANTTGIGAIRAVIASPNAMWARTDAVLLRGDGTGTAWTQNAIPAAFHFAALGEVFSLAASDSAAYMMCCNVPAPHCDPDLTKIGIGSGNRLLVYHVRTNTFALMPDIVDANGKFAIGCDGTGNGGQKFVRGFVGGRGQLGFRLLVSSAEEVYEAAAFDALGTPTAWSFLLGATCKTCGSRDPVHGDLWDVIADPSSSRVWVANDGGVYERAPTLGLDSSQWVMRNQGLHTQHIHTLSLLSTGGPAPGAIYPTSDNDGWYSPLISAPAQWHAQSSLGDANWTLSDVAAPRHALILRSRVTAETANDIVPSLRAVTFLNDMSVDGPGTAQFIQTLAGEVWPDGQLDAVALTLLPLQYVVTHADKTTETFSVDGALGSANAGRRVLIRNKNWGAATDVNLAHGAGWSLLDTVPTGTLRFWASGGHALPRYYAYAEQAGVGRLYRYERTVVGSGAHWDELNVQGGRTDPMPHAPSSIVKNTWKGPVFVNPYRQDELYVLTETGVRVSEDGGDHFTADAPLTSLVTAGGRYSLSKAFAGGDGTGVHFANRSNLNAMGALSDMAFERSNPDDVAAVSPFSGLFYRAHGTWLDLMQFTGTTIAPMSSVAIDPDMIVVATEGRGIFRLLAYHQAPNFPPIRLVRRQPPSP